MSVVILKKLENGPSYVSGADGVDVTFSENEADALAFVNGAAATAFASGKNIFGAVQVTVSGTKNFGKKSSHE